MLKMFVMIFIIVLTGVGGPPLIKLGAMRETNRINSIMSGDILSVFYVLINPYIFLGLVLYFVSAVTWIVILSKYQLSFVSPLLSVNYIFSLIVGYYLFQEPVNMARIIGAVIITIGVVIMTLKG
ncbi:EamA family transporter [Paenibacillus swuensis]|nr:EamA family transporter [Paenibacillus swuensis]